MPNPIINRRAVIVSNPFVFDPEVLDWVSRVVGNGGTVSDATRLKVNTFMVSIKAAGLRSKILRLNLFCGDQAAAGLVPLIKDAGATLDSKTAGTAYLEQSSTTANHGGFLAQNNNVDYIDTGLNPSVSMSGLTDDAHLSIFSTGSSGGGNELVMGAISTSRCYLTMAYGSGVGQVTDLWQDAGRPSNSDTDGLGHYLGTRTSNSSGGVTQYKNGSSTGSSSSVGGTASNCNANIYVTAVNNGGSPIGQMLAHWCSGYSIGSGLNSSEALDFANAWITFETSMGRV